MAVGFYGDPHGRFTIARVLHWDGTSWAPYRAPTGGSYAELYSVSADSATDVWAGGRWTDDQGYFHPLSLHFDGTRWQQVPTATPTGGDLFRSVYAIAPDDVWAVGDQMNVLFHIQPLIEHWDGTAWTVVPAPPLSGEDNSLYGVSGTSSEDVWAVGPMDNPQPPVALHWDGTQWSVVEAGGLPGRLVSFLDVVAISPGDAWVVGQSVKNDLTDVQLAAEHWDGTTWTITKIKSPGPLAPTGPLRGVGATSSTDVWAVGFSYDESFDSHPLAEHSSGPCRE